MQLKLQRSQRVGGITASTVFFALDVRAEYTSEERHNINRYKLGGQTIYNSLAAQEQLKKADAHLANAQGGTAGQMFGGLARGAVSLALAKSKLNVTIASLGSGHHIECKSLDELLEAEETLRGAAKNLTQWLQAAATFDGSEVVIDYENGEERIHITEHRPPLLTSAQVPIDSGPSQPAERPAPAPRHVEYRDEFGPAVAKYKAKLPQIGLEQELVAYLNGLGLPVTAIQLRVDAAVLILLLIYSLFTTIR